MSAKENLTKDDWLRAAMELLRTRGIGGVRVLPLAKELGVSRGSFYWHFEDRDDLLRGMLDWWDREMTDSVIQVSNGSRGNPRARLMAVAEDVLRFDRNRYEAAIRTWAEGDKRVAKTLKRVMSEASILADETLETRLRLLRRQIRLLTS
jgi:AcrR family transcriptional regulator